MLEWIRRFTASDWAAWVQAVGSIAAIAVAVWLSRRDSKERSRERVARARNAAIQLLPHFHERLSVMEHALDSKGRGCRPDNYHCDERGRTYGLLSDARIPEGLQAAFYLAAALGDAEASVQSAYLKMNQLRRLCRDHAQEDEIEHGEYFFPNEQHPLIWRFLSQTVEETKAAIGALNATIKAK